jgi:uncharacterized SAM-binding protein YcdF (DUF218 family)
MKLLYKIAEKWRADGLSQGEPDAIVAIGFTIRESGELTNCARSIMKGAAALARIYPNARVAYGVFAHSPNMEREKVAKLHALTSEGAGNERIIFLGPVSSTLTEAESAKRAFDAMGFQPRNIAIVTGAGHSRTCKWIWTTLFPHSSVGVEGFPLWEEVDPEDPMRLLRNGWTWLLSNIARHIVFRIVYFVARYPGLKALRFVRQPT